MDGETLRKAAETIAALDRISKLMARLLGAQCKTNAYLDLLVDMQIASETNPEDRSNYRRGLQEARQAHLNTERR